jgi:NADH:ubiquinone oxidoreductase subunit 5 (subunit L)/multisubunit Na+/H+ antiporter MnhA subunit
MDRLGGLWRRMPRTGLCFLVGAGAISGLPLLNGFVGEFALYRGLFAAVARADSGVALLATTALAGLALVSGLALVAFLRCAATLFLGRARTAAAAAAHEAPTSMTAPMSALALACVVLGLLPQLALPVLAPVAAAWAPLAGDPTVALAQLLPLWTVSALALGCGASVALLLRWLRRRQRRQQGTPAVGTWDCGFADAGSPRLQYTASSFAQFAATLLRWTVRERGPGPQPLALFPAPREFDREPVEPLLQGLLWPLGRRLADRCARLRFLQHGRLQIYLLYILVVLLLLLGWSGLAAWLRP